MPKSTILSPGIASTRRDSISIGCESLKSCDEQDYVPQTIDPNLIKPYLMGAKKIGKTALDLLREGKKRDLTNRKKKIIIIIS